MLNLLLILVNVIRTLVIFLIQSAATVAILALLEPMLERARQAVKDAFGLSEEDSTTYVANMLLDIVELAGVSIVVFKSRLPLKIADKLGLTKRNFTRGALPAKVSSGPNAPGAIAKKATTPKKVPTAAEAQVIISAAKAGSAGVKNVFSFLEGRLNSVFLGVLAGSALLDFANWETGAYSQGMQKLYSTISFGLIRPDEDWRKSKTASDDVFGKVYDTYRLNGAVAINDGYKRQSVPFTRDNMLDLIDRLGADSLLATGKADTKSLLAASQTMIVFERSKIIALGSSSSGGSTGSGSGSSSGSSGTPSQGTLNTIPKVFTGIVSQGALGNQDNFEPRPDDLITDTDDLTKAAANNIAPFLAAIPGRIRYEIKIVSSYVDKNGYTHKGTTQRIAAGTYANGTQKYKTVTNKFAVANMYILTSKGSRTKLDMIVLGPVDSGRFQPVAADVDDLSATLASSMTSSYSSAAKLSKSSGSSKSKDDDNEDGMVNAREDGKATGILLRKSEDGRNVYQVKYISRDKEYTTEYTGESIADIFSKLSRSSLSVITLAGLTPSQISSGNYFDPGLPEEEEKTTPASELAGRPPLKKKADGSEQKIVKDPDTGQDIYEDTGEFVNQEQFLTPALKNAKTLSEWYQAKGTPLPTVAERSVIYEQLGLGTASFYSGTAEQNSKLLAALKNQ